jgi:hypothetical protein
MNYELDIFIPGAESWKKPPPLPKPQEIPPIRKNPVEKKHIKKSGKK